MIKTVEEAISLLRKLGAKERLLIHIKLVEEASEIARFCLSHARWRETECSFEELLVALADNLWIHVSSPLPLMAPTDYIKVYKN